MSSLKYNNQMDIDMQITYEQLLDNLKNSTLNEVSFENLEFKSKWEQHHGKSISAFANHLGIKNGFIIIGIDDHGNITKKDQNFLVDTEHALSNQLNQYLSPFSAAQICAEQFDNSSVIIVKVTNQGDITKWNNKAYKRVGTSSIEMSPGEILDLSLQLPGQDFSKNSVENFNTNPSLVTEFASKLIRNQNYSSLPTDISTISSNEILQKIKCKNKMAGKILFGETLVRIAFFNGDGDVISQPEKQGVFYLLSDAFIEEIQTWTKTKGTILEENSIALAQEQPYPPKALRECLANAVCHALYERNLGEIVVELHPNRIVVKNNCSLDMKTFSKEWFSRKNYSKNKFLMQLLREAGFADELGSGKMRLYSQMLEAGKREPIIEFYERGQFGCWTISLFNEQNDKTYLKLLTRFKQIFKTPEEANLAMSLILWRENLWSNVLEKLDAYYQSLALEIIKSNESPIIVDIDNDTIFLKRWAKNALDGQDSRRFTSSEEEQFKRIIQKVAYAEGRNGSFTTEEARFHFGLSSTASERTQLSNLFVRWEKEGILIKKKRGEWNFKNRPLYLSNFIFSFNHRFDPERYEKFLNSFINSKS